uniref:Small ribosomal subunit protein uS3m n=1 Tax=Auxenochlorella protothecoides TaxID=3075 RepID=A0A0A6ZEJ0_AUXPR|nr:ribosomal protein S3 [Auxenochlorella protothecoides]AGN72423.1 ribosomal protein S3 [Auxenochlorella protothecoides]ARV87629.1 SSU ribosomal protein S3p [Auxenochlorella protothecoides]
MGQKTNPISLRLQNVNRNFDSTWYSDHFYAKCFSRELFLTNYLNTFLKLVRLPQARVSVNFGIQNIKLYPFFCIPRASRVSLAKNLGLFQHLSKAWSNLPKSFVSLKSKKSGLGWFGNDKKSKLVATNLHDNLFFKTIPKINKPHVFHEISKKLHNNNNLHESNLVNGSITLAKKPEHQVGAPNFYFLENISAKLLLNSLVSDSFWSKQTPNLETNTSKRNLKNLLLQYYLVGARKESGYNNDIAYQSNDLTNTGLEHISNHLFVDGFQNKEYNSLNSENIFKYSLQKKGSNKIKGLTKTNEMKTIGVTHVTQNMSLSFMPALQKDHFETDQKLYNKLDSSTQIQSLSKINEVYKTNEINSLLDTNNLLKFGLEQTNIYNALDSTRSMISQKKFKYKTHIENFLSSHYNIDLQLFPFYSKQNWQSAGFVADEIVYFIERRVSFSRIKNRILRQASMQPFIRGIRITCNGRVGGKSKKAQRATQECVKYGETSLHVFDCKIDFASRSANTSFGLVGIKVWICFK